MVTIFNILILCAMANSNNQGGNNGGSQRGKEKREGGRNQESNS